jgi:hypothetical protein
LDYVDKIPYNTCEGIQEVLNQVSEAQSQGENRQAGRILRRPLVEGAGDAGILQAVVEVRSLRMEDRGWKMDDDDGRAKMEDQGFTIKIRLS